MDANDKHSITGGKFANAAEGFNVAAPQRVVSFDTENASIPPGRYVSADDFLVIQCLANFVPNPGICNVRILAPDGEIVCLPITIPVFAANTLTTFKQQLVEGWLLSATLCSVGTTGANGVYFASIGITRTPANNTGHYEVLVSGYLNAWFPISWPEHVPQRQTDGPGLTRSLQIANPAAGAEFTFTNATMTRLRVTSISATLTTAVAAANRMANVVIDDGANIVAQLPAFSLQAASLAFVYTGSSGVAGYLAPGTTVVIGFPSDLMLAASWRIRSLTTAIQAADQWSNIWMSVQEWRDFV